MTTQSFSPFHDIITELNCILISNDRKDIDYDFGMV
jgi:hypothetical protein